MNPKARLFWLVVHWAAVGVAGVGISFWLDWYFREPPNFSRIEDGLWLGGNVLAPPPGVGAVLNLCEFDDPYRGESHRWEPIRDAPPAPTLAWLGEQVAFIEAERSKGRAVFVHCRNGVSRSGMVVVAYVMKSHRWHKDKAMDFVRLGRPGLRPNPAFSELLDEWEQTLAQRR